VLAFFVPVAKQQAAQAFETASGLLQGQQQPEVQAHPLHQNAAIFRGQGVAFEPRDQGLAFFPVQSDFVRLLHCGLYPFPWQRMRRVRFQLRGPVYRITWQMSSSLAGGTEGVNRTNERKVSQGLINAIKSMAA
jgi:hypothetical protein